MADDLVPNDPQRTMTRTDLDALACDWSDYRKDYGASRDPGQNRKDHMLFSAGWKARHNYPPTGPSPEREWNPGDSHVLPEVSAAAYPPGATSLPEGDGPTPEHYMYAAIRTALADAWDRGADAGVNNYVDGRNGDGKNQTTNPYRVQVAESVDELIDLSRERFSGAVWACPFCQDSGMVPTDEHVPDRIADHANLFHPRPRNRVWSRRDFEPGAPDPRRQDGE